MKIGFYLLLAIGNMWRHKLRTGLTLLGLIVGITSVLVMSGIGKGFAQIMEEDFASLQANKMTLRTGFSQDEGQVPLTLADADKLANQIGYTAIDVVVPQVSVWDLSIKGIAPDDQYVNSTATTADYIETVDWTIRRGRFFTPEEAERRAAVVVINQALADYLRQQGRQSLSELIINNERFSVVGIVEEENDMFGGGFPALFVPITLLQKKLISQAVRRHNGSLVLDEIQVMATDADSVEQAKREIESVIRLAQNRKADEPNSFSLQSQQDFLEITQNFSQGFTLVLGGIGAISLIVGGIGVMNIMLAAIAERTREVGLRKALGATNGDILFQFLTESVAICLAGGLLGVLISYGLATLLVSIFPEGEGPGLRIVVDLTSIGIAVVSSTLCGLIFGMYPAIRAMRLRPIEALRYE